MNKYFTKRRIVLGVFIVLIVILFSTSLYFRETIFNLINNFALFIEKHNFTGFFIFVGVAILAETLSPLSSLPLIPSAVIAWGHFLTLFFLLFGWIIGSIIGYYVGYYARIKFLENYLPIEKIDYYRSKMSNKTEFFLVLLFRLAVPSEIAIYTIGIIKYDFKKALAISLIAETPFAIVAVYSTQAFYKGDMFAFAGIIAITLAVMVFLTFELKKRLK